MIAAIPRVLGLALALAWALPAGAAFDSGPAQYRLLINGLSFHFATETPRSELRETNPGLGLEGRWLGGVFAVAATYQDSYDGDSWLAGVGKRWAFWKSERGTLYVAGGGVIGVTYRRLEFGDPDRDLAGGVLPVLTLGAGAVEANLTVLPKLPGMIDDPAVALNFSLPLN